MAVGAAYLPSGSNTFIRDHKSTGYLRTQFSRNAKDFPLMRYCQIREVTKEAGYYLRMTAENAARLVGGNLNDFVWPDGAPRPRNNNNTESIAWANYQTERFNFGFQLGDKARKQADWQIEESEALNHAQQAMTGRALRVHTKLQASGSWNSGHTIDVTAISGVAGRWDVSTSTRLDMKKSINYGVDVIRKATLGAVRQKKDLFLVMSPRTARAIGETQEMIDVLKQSRDGIKHFRGDEPDYSEYGVPNRLYGLEIVVEDTVMVTSRRGASSVTRTDVCADGQVYLLARPGGITSKAGSGPSYCSMMIFAYEDMTVETQQFPNDRRMEGHVVDDTAEEMVAPAACFRFENVIA